MPDSDTAALLMVVSNTASTVSNTLKILEVAKDASDKIDQYNFIAMRRYFIARRIEQHAREVVAAKKFRPKNLEELNSALLHLKLNLQGLKDNINFLSEEVLKAHNFTDQYYFKKLSAETDSKEAHRQELQSASEGNMSKHVQNTAMNTAISSKVLAEMRKDNIEFQRAQIGLQKAKLTTQIRQESHYKEWIGIPSKQKHQMSQRELR